MQKALFSFLTILIAFSSAAQLRMDVERVGNNGWGQINFYDVDGSTIPYDKISGSPLWQDKWNTAHFFDSDGRSFGVYQAKLNLATDEVLYLDKDGEIWGTQSVEKIIFYTGSDTSKVLAVFSRSKPYIFDSNNKNYFAEVMNKGDVQLLKISKRIVASADSMFNTLKRYYFTTDAHYYIYRNRQTEYLRKLDKENVLFPIPSYAKYERWIKQNKINFTREKDVIRFIDYYNEMEK
jgi:hypothetical protein